MNKAFGALFLLLGMAGIGVGALNPMWLFPRIPFSLYLLVSSVFIIIGAVLVSTAEAGDFKPDKSLLNADNRPCPICGGKDFTWGYVRSPYFAPRFSTRRVGYVGSGEPVACRKCDSCGNVTWFAKQRP